MKARQQVSFVVMFVAAVVDFSGFFLLFFCLFLYFCCYRLGMGGGVTLRLLLLAFILLVRSRSG